MMQKYDYELVIANMPFQMKANIYNYVFGDVENLGEPERKIQKR